MRCLHLFAVILAVFTVLPFAHAFDSEDLNTPDNWSQHITPGKFEKSYTGIGLTEDTSLYLTLTSRYRLRANDNADDQDFYQYLRLSTDEVDFGNGTLRFTAFSRFADDIDGNSSKQWSEKYFYSQRDILDAESDNNDWAPRLYYGYAAINGVIPNTDINIGRFYLSHQNTFQLDGADAAVDLNDSITVYAFGGKPVSYYYDIGSSRVYGGGVNITPVDSLKIGAEYTFLDVENIEDDYTKLRIDKYFSNGNIAVSYDVLDSADTLNIDMNYEIASSGTIITAGYESLLDEMDYDNTYVVNPLTYALLPEKKYKKYNLSLYQAIGSHLAACITYLNKSVDGNGNFDNRDYSRIQGKVDVFGLPHKNTYVSIGVEYWNIDKTENTDDNSRLQYSFQLSQKTGENTEVWLGSSFSRYEYDYDTDKRKDSVRSYYLGGQYQPSDLISFLADISIEDTDFYDDLTDDMDRNYTAELWANLAF
jgi:hypothetical protein